MMVRARLPWRALDTYVEEAFSKGRLPADVDWDGMGDVVKHLLKLCLTVNMYDRPPAMELLMHRFFRMKPAPGAADSSPMRWNQRPHVEEHVGDMFTDEAEAGRGHDIFQLRRSCGLVAIQARRAQVVSPGFLDRSPLHFRSRAMTMYVSSNTSPTRVGNSPLACRKEHGRFDTLLHLAERRYNMQAVPPFPQFSPPR